MFIYIILILIDICIGRCYANFRLIFAYIINMPLCYVSDILTYVYKEADVIAFDCMADGRCYCHVLIYRADVKPIFGICISRG